MRGLTTLIVMAGLFSMSLLVGIPVMDQLAPLVIEMTPEAYDSMINNIWETTVKWIVPISLGTVVIWAVFWILRTERQEVRR